MSTKKTPAKKVAAKKPSTKKVVVKKARTPVVKTDIELVVTTKGETFKGKVAPNGIAQFIVDMELSSTNTATVFKATYGKKIVEKVYNVHVMRKLFRQALAREVLQKQICLALGL